MLCPECGKRPATLHYTKIINGKKTEFQLCEVCATEKGEYMLEFDDGFSFHQLLSGLLNFEHSPGAPHQEMAHSAKIDRCPVCGLTHQQFSQSGRFGCKACFGTFREYLHPLIRRIHGHTKHRGKIPARTKGELRLRKEIEMLKEELAQKVQREEFEEAAQLRDKIRSIQERMKE